MICVSLFMIPTTMPQQVQRTKTDSLLYRTIRAARVMTTAQSETRTEIKKNTFVVTVTDKTNVVIPNCDIHIGESNNIVVDLPDGIKAHTRENPVIVTVTDHNGEAQKDITVIAIGDADFMEKGSTDMYAARLHFQLLRTDTQTRTERLMLTISM